MATKSKSSKLSIDLALQGGGTHGAFTWGVLDALLEDGRFIPDGVSGTSAGAMNAAVMATGYARQGADGARTALAQFWNDVGGAPVGLGAQVGLPSFLANRDQWFGWQWLEAWQRMWSPYQTNPLNIDPLRAIVEKHVDWHLVRSGPIQVFITATSVRTGQAHVFAEDRLCIDALMASACLPQTSQAVMIHGEPYWDGGFAGNPSIWPLIYNTPSDDVLLVQLNPLIHEGIPKTTAEINDRLNEITFNASLVAELRAIAFVQKLKAQGKLDKGYKSLRMHRIEGAERLAPYDASSKLNNDPRFLQTLFSLGREAGEEWLAKHAHDIGVRSTVDIHESFLSQR